MLSAFRILFRRLRLAVRWPSPLVLALALAVGGCGGGGGDRPPPPAAPVIQSFIAEPASIVAGQDATLRWTVAGASALAITPGIGAVTGNSLSVHPAATTTYTLTASSAGGSAQASATVVVTLPSTVRIAYLHHSTGGVIWDGGIPDLLTAHNSARGTKYQIQALDYPLTRYGYPWDNYPFDYWNLWVLHTGADQDRGELNLDALAAQYDVIVFKHCFPVSEVEPDDGHPDIGSTLKTVANYQLQYQALKARMRQFPSKSFLVWTGAARRQSQTDRAHALRAKQFFDWVTGTWNEPGDNIFVWDFRALEVAGSSEGLYLNDAFASADSHPNPTFARTVAPFFVRRLVDVIEGRGDSGSLTGE